jgi:hypothetical protein
MTQVLMVVVALLAALGLLYALWRPHWVFILVIMMFPLEQLLQAYIPFLAAHRTFVNIAIGLMTIFGIVTRLGRRDHIGQTYLNPVMLLVLALYVTWLVGATFSPAGAQAYEVVSFSLPYLCLLVVLLPLLIVDLPEFRRMTTGYMVLGTAIAILIIANPMSSYHSGRLSLDLGMVGGHIRERGNPLALGELGGSMALIAALIRPMSATTLFTLVRIAAFVAGFGLAIGSGSRGQVLAAGIAGVLFYPMSRRLANPKQFVINSIGFGVLVLGLFAVFKLFVGYENRERWEVWGMLRDTMLRMDMVWELFAAFLASPGNWPLGLGTAAYSVIGGSRHADYVHNVAAEILCEHGLVGFTLFLLIVGLTFKCGFRVWSIYREDPVMRATAAVLAAMCFYALLLALKQGSISSGAPFYWWLVLAKISYFEQRRAATSVQWIDDSVVAPEHDLIDPELALGYQQRA